MQRLLQGYGVVREMERTKTEADNPVNEVLIADCGQLSEDDKTSSTNGPVSPISLSDALCYAMMLTCPIFLLAVMRRLATPTS